MLCRKLDLAGETASAALQKDDLDLTRKDERAAHFYLYYIRAVLAGEATAAEVCKAKALSLAEDEPATLSIFGF